MAARPELAIDLYADGAIRDPHPLYRAIRDRAPAVWLPAARRVGDRPLRGRPRGAARRHGARLRSRRRAERPRERPARRHDAHERRRAPPPAARACVIRPMLPSALAEVRAEIERLATTPSRSSLARGLLRRHRRLRAAPPRRGGVAARRPSRSRARAHARLGEGRLRRAGPVERAGAGVRRALPRDGEVRDGDRARARSRPPAGRRACSRRRTAASSPARTCAASSSTTSRRASTRRSSAPATSSTCSAATPSSTSACARIPRRFRAPCTRRSASSRRCAPSPATRRATTTAGGVIIAKGERALILYGSANRDERRYADPDRFDVGRDARDHVAFGYGVHRCAGGFLAQLEMEALLRALTARVRRIEVGEPTWLLSNVLRGYAGFPATFHP